MHAMGAAPTIVRLATAAGLAPADARALAAHALGVTTAWLAAHDRDQLDPAHARSLAALFARRAAGEPVAYLTGVREFYGLAFEVSPAVLVPRPETELLVDLAIERVPPGGRFADLGTGSGAIAIAFAAHRPDATVIATDASAAALELARRNAERHGARVTFRAGDWLAPLVGEAFDVIASNPPYVADADPHLARGDLRFEPRVALASGADGLDAIRCIVAGARAHLRERGWLLLEHGWNQAGEVRALLGAAFVEVHSRPDLQGHDRVSGGRLRSASMLASAASSIPGPP